VSTLAGIDVVDLLIDVASRSSEKENGRRPLGARERLAG
jgi:hypothetical protein